MMHLLKCNFFARTKLVLGDQLTILKIQFEDPTWELPIETFVTPECAWVQNLPLSEHKKQIDGSREMHFFCIDKFGCRWSIINFKNEIPKIWNDMSKQTTYLNLSKWQNNSTI